MLETVDLSRSLPKDEYKRVRDEIGLKLADLQRQCKDDGVPTVVVFEGWDAAGKGSIINRLTQALDPRGYNVHPIQPPTEDEGFHPFLWRFWRRLPKAGIVGIFDHSWYRRVLHDRVDGRASRREWERAYDEINAFERQLTDDGYAIVKFWLHISRDEQKKRFKKLLADADFAWRVGPDERRRRKQWEQYAEAVEGMFERTSTGDAPWTIVEANCGRFAHVKVAEAILDRQALMLERKRRRVAVRAMEKEREASPEEAQASSTSVARSNPLDHADLSLSLERADYEAQLDELRERVVRLEHQIYVARTPVVMVYEGWDAAGKGGNIRRLTSAMDPRGYEVVPIAAPSTDEKAHHWLRRFWIRVPKAGHITIFDRSWYGRVMVERVEGFCTEDDWRRAYQEINEFESQLASAGAVIVKFWIHISADEQLRRFEDRMNTPHKRWKITDEDWRNREKWDAYYAAVGEMIQRTSTSYAPWTIVEGNCKLWARIRAIRAVAEAMENALD